MKKLAVILCGIPCSGKSTFSKYEQLTKQDVAIVSRDSIRENLEEIHNMKFKPTKRNEDWVTMLYQNKLKEALASKYVNIIILDNTHCKEKYLDAAIKSVQDCRIQILKFKVSILKAFYRNIIRYLGRGKWIPFKIILNMRKNFKRINWLKYTEYIDVK